jgi:hypothetical protein
MSTSTLTLTQAGNHLEREFCTVQFTLSRRDTPSFRAGRTSTLDAINHVKLSNPGVFSVTLLNIATHVPIFADTSTMPATPPVNKAPKRPPKTASTGKKSRVSKVSIERIDKIVRLIRKRGSVSMPFLKKELEVSQASVKRDIDFLRDRLNCPLEWDRSKSGYVIRDQLAPGGRFELPGVWFEASEVLALLTMLHLVEGVQPTLLEDHVGPLKNRLHNMLSEGTSSPTPIEKKSN